MTEEIRNSITKNTTVMLGAQMITWLSSFVLLMFLPRYLGSANYGQLYLALSVAMILSIIIDFGGNYLIPKEVARTKEKTSRILISYIGVRLLVWAACMGGLILFSYVVGYSTTVVTLLIVLGGSKLFEGVSKAIRSCFQGHEMMEYPSVGVIAEKVFVSLTAVTALLLGAGPITIAIIMAIGVVINLLTCLKFLPYIVESIPNFRINISFGLIKSSIPYFLWSIFAVIYYRIDTVMLSTMTTENVVGWYGGAYRFFDVVMFLPSILTTVLFPILSKLTDDRDGDLSNTFTQSLKYMVMASIPMTVLFFLFAENIVQLFYGLGEYGPSVVVLQVFAPGIILVYIDFIMGSTILATDKQRLWAGIGFAGILLNIGLNYLMIPYAQELWANGGIGAAITTLITELFIMGSAFTILPRRYYGDFALQIPVKGVFCGGIMAAVLWGMFEMNIFWMVQIGVGLITYVSACIAVGLISQNELEYFKKTFAEKKLMSILNPKREKI